MTDSDQQTAWDRDGFFITRELLTAEEVELLGRIAQTEEDRRSEPDGAFDALRRAFGYTQRRASAPGPRGSR